MANNRNAGRKPKMTDEEIRLLVQLYKDSITPTALAYKNNISVPTLYRYFRKLSQLEVMVMETSEVNYHLIVNGIEQEDRLTMTEVKNMARNLAAEGYEIYVKWYRYQDGQNGYLNSDGDHEITGRLW